MDIERSPPVQRGNEFCLRFILQSPKEESLVVVEWSERIYSLGFYLSDKLRNDPGIQRDAKKGRRVDSVSGYGSTVGRSLESDFSVTSQLNQIRPRLKL